MSHDAFTTGSADMVDLCGMDVDTWRRQTAPTSQKLIPFVVSAEQAQATCRAWMGSEFTHPRDLKTLAKVGAPAGVYLSAWQWSGRAISTWSAVVVYIERIEKTTETNSPPGTAPTSEPTEVKVIRHPPMTESGDHEEWYPNRLILAFATPPWLHSQWPTETSYDLDQLTPFDPESVAQYRVEPPTIEREATRLTVCQQIKKAEEAACKALIPGDEVKSSDVNTRVVSLADTLIHLPIWRLSYEYGGKTYQCQVNGQSGASVCEGPVDQGRSLLRYLIILLIVGIVVLIIVYMTRTR
jgi:hypothetical protein